MKHRDILVSLVTPSEGPEGLSFPQVAPSIFSSYFCFTFAFQNRYDNKIIYISTQGSSEVKKGIFQLSIIFNNFWATEFSIGKVHVAALFSLIFVKGLTWWHSCSYIITTHFIATLNMQLFLDISSDVTAI